MRLSRIAAHDNRHACADSRLRGFSLIELMIVIVLMSLLAAIVAPLTFRQLDRAKAKTEYLVFRNTLKSLSAKAFTQGLSYEIKMAGNSYTARSVLGQRVYQLEYLTLPNKSFSINRNGYPSIHAFTLDLAGIDRKISMLDMLGVKQELVYEKDK